MVRVNCLVIVKESKIILIFLFKGMFLAIFLTQHVSMAPLVLFYFLNHFYFISVFIWVCYQLFDQFSFLLLCFSSIYLSYNPSFDIYIFQQFY